MTKASLGSDDFVIAAKTDRPLRDAQRQDEPLDTRPHQESDTSTETSHDTVLPRLSRPERKEKLTSRALVREDARLALKQLKRAKERDAKFYVNVALSYDMKNRLKQAAHDNDINMTIIMQAAIEAYLVDNGY
jgi:hypothetical protein